MAQAGQGGDGAGDFFLAQSTMKVQTQRGKVVFGERHDHPAAIAFASAPGDQSPRFGPSDALPGVSGLLAELDDAGIPFALASASRNAPTVLSRLGLDGRFAAVVDPASAFRGKPEPEIFERGAAALGLLTDECVGVEDATAGIEAILGAGMAAVGVGDHSTLLAAHLIVRTPAHLTLHKLREGHAVAFAGGRHG